MMGDFVKAIADFIPGCEQEESDKRVILDYIRRFPDTVLSRENEIAHITSSGFAMNPALNKALLIHHDIMGKWAWTGGHADGDAELLRVAIREAREETGVLDIHPLFEDIASVDILTVAGHERRGRYVSAHLHLSVAYILICGEVQPIRAKAGENTGAAWFGADYFTSEHFDAGDVHLYGKLIERAHSLRTSLHGPMGTLHAEHTNP